MVGIVNDNVKNDKKSKTDIYPSCFFE